MNAYLCEYILAWVRPCVSVYYLHVRLDIVNVLEVRQRYGKIETKHKDSTGKSGQKVDDAGNNGLETNLRQTKKHKESMLLLTCRRRLQR